MIEIYRDTCKIRTDSQYSALYGIIQKIDVLVQEYADRAYNLSALNYSNPKQKNFVDSAQCYFKNGIIGFMCTYYGYVVEELVNLELMSHTGAMEGGYRVELQATHGSTRPDIVIKDFSGKERAWLDITSENSAGHIYRKDGSGWRDTDFVAELLYPTFNVKCLRNSDDVGIGIRIRAISVSRKASIRQYHLVSHLKSKLSVALRIFSEKYPVDKSTLAAVIESAFGVRFEEYRKHPAIKSMLKKYLECCPYSDYVPLIRQILNSYYNNDRQDLLLAMRFITKSYEKEQEKNEIYFYYDDSYD